MICVQARPGRELSNNAHCDTPSLERKGYDTAKIECCAASGDVQFYLVFTFKMRVDELRGDTGGRQASEKGKRTIRRPNYRGH
jgi:hypothetical protein